MKANELMIGDWVHVEAHRGFNAQNVKVETIPDNDGDNKYGHHYGHISTWLDGGDNDFRDVEVKHLQPIPLTPEILEKNGFKPYIPEGHLETVYACQDVSKAVADELYALWPYRDGSFYLLLRVDGKDMVRMDVHYIHQLQQALRLCGITREIIL